MNPLVEVDFHGATLVAVKGASPADTLVAMKPVAEGMGLAWSGQFEKIKDHPVMAQSVREIRMVAEDGKLREMTALPLSKLNFWLATIQPNKIKDAATRAKVIEYQEECADVLFAHFFAKATGVEASELARRTDGISRMLAHKVTGMEKELAELVSAVRSLVITHDPRVAAVDAIPALQIAVDAKVPAAGRRPIVRAISNNLARHCEARGHVIRRDVRGTKLYPLAAVAEWKRDGGEALIRKLAAQNAPIGPLFAITGGKAP